MRIRLPFKNGWHYRDGFKAWAHGCPVYLHHEPFYGWTVSDRETGGKITAQATQRAAIMRAASLIAKASPQKMAAAKRTLLREHRALGLR